eukprot:764357-Amphidinium_carterae.3
MKHQNAWICDSGWEQIQLSFHPVSLRRLSICLTQSPKFGSTSARNLSTSLSLRSFLGVLSSFPFFFFLQSDDVLESKSWSRSFFVIIIPAVSITSSSFFGTVLGCEMVHHTAALPPVAGRCHVKIKRGKCAINELQSQESGEAVGIL